MYECVYIFYVVYNIICWFSLVTLCEYLLRKLELNDIALVCIRKSFWFWFCGVLVGAFDMELEGTDQ